MMRTAHTLPFAPESQAAAETRASRFVRSMVRLLTWGSAVDGRLILIGAIIVYLTIIAAVRLLWGVDVWPSLGVPSGPSLFFDARNLTAAWESSRFGYDPLYISSRDPWGRPLMYLRPWLLLGVLGLDQSHTVAIGVVLVTAMFLSFASLVGRVTAGTGVVLAFAACSPAVMFAVERANMDIALFSLIAIALLLWRTFPRPAAVASPMLVLIGAMAKLYPVFALPAFIVAFSRTASRTAIICMAVFAVYCVYSLKDILHVAQIAIQGEGFSYGVRILPAHLYHQVGADRWAGPAALKQLLAAVPLGCLALAIVLRVRRRVGSPGNERTPTTAALLGLHVGSLIYLGTFATANNFDYRLVFLLLTLPQLVEWAAHPAHRLSSLAAATLLSILVLLWVGSLSEQLHLWDELASWIVAGELTALIAVTLPRLSSLRSVVMGDDAGGRVDPVTNT
jgi:hypothetical protein